MPVLRWQRPGAAGKDAAGDHPRRYRGRHPHPPAWRGRSRRPRRPAGRPLHLRQHRRPSLLPPRRRRYPLPGAVADDQRGAGRQHRGADGQRRAGAHQHSVWYPERRDLPATRQGHEHPASPGARRHVRGSGRRDSGQPHRQAAQAAAGVRRRRHRGQDQPGKPQLLRQG